MALSAVANDAGGKGGKQAAGGGGGMAGGSLPLRSIMSCLPAFRAVKEWKGYCIRKVFWIWIGVGPCRLAGRETQKLSSAVVACFVNTMHGQIPWVVKPLRRHEKKQTGLVVTVPCWCLQLVRACRHACSEHAFRGVSLEALVPLIRSGAIPPTPSTSTTTPHTQTFNPKPVPTQNNLPYPPPGLM